MLQKSRKPIIFTIVLGLCLIVTLMIGYFHSNNGAKPYEMAPLATRPGTDILIITDDSFSEFQNFSNSWQKKAQKNSVTLKIFTPRIFTLRRSLQLLRSLTPKPKVLILSTQSSEGKETVYHFETAYQVLDELNGKSHLLAKYQLSETLNLDQNSYNEVEWKLKNLVDIKLYGVEMDELLDYLQKNKIKLLMLTSPLPSEEMLKDICPHFASEENFNVDQIRANIAQTCPQKAMLTLANQVTRLRAQDYGFVLYDWEAQLLESAARPRIENVRKLNQDLMKLVFNQLL